MFEWFKKGGESALPQSNDEWVDALSAPPDESAIRHLRRILVRGLKPALSKYVDRELASFVEDVAQDALLKILANIHSFRGESKFTTWAMKIAVREGLTELRRKRYNDISLDDLTYDDNDSEIRSPAFASEEPTPQRTTHEAMLVEKVMGIIEEELTEKQKRVITALMVSGLPVSVVAEQMDTNRNALYKLVHDARMKIKNRFEIDGIDPDEILDRM